MFLFDLIQKKSPTIINKIEIKIKVHLAEVQKLEKRIRVGFISGKW
jgi:hypothetical protein